MEHVNIFGASSPAHVGHRSRSTIQKHFRDRSQSTSMSSLSELVSPSPRQPGAVRLKRLSSQSDAESNRGAGLPGADRSRPLPPPAFVQTPLGGLCSTPRSPLKTNLRDIGFSTPKNNGGREASSIRTSVESLRRSGFGALGSWTCPDEPSSSQTVLGGGDGTGMADSDGGVRGNRGNSVDFMGSGNVGSRKRSDAGSATSRRRIFSNVPSPSHLRRTVSFASSFSAITRSASRMANGMMTPVRRRRHQREGSETVDGGSGNLRDTMFRRVGGSDRIRVSNRRSRSFGRSLSSRPVIHADVVGLESPDTTRRVSSEEESPQPKLGGIDGGQIFVASCREWNNQTSRGGSNRSERSDKHSKDRGIPEELETIGNSLGQDETDLHGVVGRLARVDGDGKLGDVGVSGMASETESVCPTSTLSKGGALLQTGGTETDMETRKPESGRGASSPKASLPLAPAAPPSESLSGLVDWYWSGTMASNVSRRVTALTTEGVEEGEGTGGDRGKLTVVRGGSDRGSSEDGGHAPEVARGRALSVERRKNSQPQAARRELERRHLRSISSSHAGKSLAHRSSLSSLSGAVPRDTLRVTANIPPSPAHSKASLTPRRRAYPHGRISVSRRARSSHFSSGSSSIFSSVQDTTDEVSIGLSTSNVSLSEAESIASSSVGSNGEESAPPKLELMVAPTAVKPIRGRSFSADSIGTPPAVMGVLRPPAAAVRALPATGGLRSIGKDLGSMARVDPSVSRKPTLSAGDSRSTQTVSVSTGLESTDVSGSEGLLGLRRAGPAATSGSRDSRMTSETVDKDTTTALSLREAANSGDGDRYREVGQPEPKGAPGRWQVLMESTIRSRPVAEAGCVFRSVEDAETALLLRAAADSEEWDHRHKLGPPPAFVSRRAPEPEGPPGQLLPVRLASGTRSTSTADAGVMSLSVEDAVTELLLRAEADSEDWDHPLGLAPAPEHVSVRASEPECLLGQPQVGPTRGMRSSPIRDADGVSLSVKDAAGELLPTASKDSEEWGRRYGLGPVQASVPVKALEPEDLLGRSHADPASGTRSRPVAEMDLMSLSVEDAAIEHLPRTSKDLEGWDPRHGLDPAQTSEPVPVPVPMGATERQALLGRPQIGPVSEGRSSGVAEADVTSLSVEEGSSTSLFLSAASDTLSTASAPKGTSSVGTHDPKTTATGDVKEGALAMSLMPSPTPTQTGQDRRDDGLTCHDRANSEGIHSGTPRGRLEGGFECRDGPPSSPDSFMSDTSGFSSARSTSICSSNAGDTSELSISDRSVPSECSRLKKHRLEERRRAALISAACSRRRPGRSNSGVAEGPPVGLPSPSTALRKGNHPPRAPLPLSHFRSEGSGELRWIRAAGVTRGVSSLGVRGLDQGAKSDARLVEVVDVENYNKVGRLVAGFSTPGKALSPPGKTSSREHLQQRQPQRPPPKVRDAPGGGQLLEGQAEEADQPGDKPGMCLPPRGGALEADAGEKVKLPPLRPPPMPRILRLASSSDIPTDSVFPDEDPSSRQSPSPPPLASDRILCNVQRKEDKEQEQPKMSEADDGLMRSSDDLPPAEMGALGASLYCALCGAAERPETPNGGKVSQGPNGWNRGGEKGSGSATTSTSGNLEFVRCSRCRRGCCGDCFRRLPVYCRGPQVIVPVCRDCFRPVDFENRWHSHLFATSRERNSVNGLKETSECTLHPQQMAGDKGCDVDSTGYAGVAASDRRWAMERVSLPKQDALNDAGERLAPGATSRPWNPPVMNGSRSSGGRLLRRSVSNVRDAFGDSSGFKLTPSLAALLRDAANDGTFSSGFSSVDVRCRPRSLPRSMSSTSSATADDSENPFGSSLSSAFQSLDLLSGTGGSQGLRGNTAFRAAPGLAAALASASAPIQLEAIKGAGASASRASHTAQGVDMLASSLGLTSSRVSYRSQKDGGTRVPSSKEVPVKDAHRRPGSLLTKPDFFVGATNCGVGPGGGTEAVEIQPRGGRVSPIKAQGRPPLECPCGAAALYCEIVGVGGTWAAGSDLARDGRAFKTVAGSEAAEASIVEKCAAAERKLARSMAHAHLLTRGMKALAYARLQEEAFKFLCARAAEAKASATDVVDTRTKAELPRPPTEHPPSPPRLPCALGQPASASARHLVGSAGPEITRRGNASPLHAGPLGKPQASARATIAGAGIHTCSGETEGTIGNERTAKIGGPLLSERGVLDLDGTNELPPDAPSALRRPSGVHNSAAAPSARRARTPVPTPTFAPAPAPAAPPAPALERIPVFKPEAAHTPPPSSASALVVTSKALITSTVSGAHQRNSSQRADGCSPVRQGTSRVSPSTPGASGFRANFPSVTRRWNAPDNRAGGATPGRVTGDDAGSGRRKRVQDSKARDHRRFDLVMENLRRARDFGSVRNSRKDLRDSARRRSSGDISRLSGDMGSVEDDGEGTDGEEMKTEATEVESRLASPPPDGTEESEGSHRNRRVEREVNGVRSPYNGDGREVVALPTDGVSPRDDGEGGDVDGAVATIGVRKTRSSTIGAPERLMMSRSGFHDGAGADVLRLMKDRDALFDRMLSGPGITATKYPRRGRPRAVVLTLSLIGNNPSEASALSKSMSTRSGWTASPGSMDDGVDTRSRSESMVRVHQRPISSLLDLELVWNRQRGGRGRLKLSDVVDAVSGPQSQVLRPIFEDMKKRAVKRRGGSVETLGGTLGEDTFGSLVTRRRSLDLRFSTVLTRDRFLSAFKTFAWEASLSAAGNVDPPEDLRSFAKRVGLSELAHVSGTA